MAISYELDLVTKLEPEQALKLISSQKKLFGLDNSLREDGIQIRASYLDESEQLLAEEMPQFHPTLAINFRLNPNQYDTAMKALCNATLALLTQEPGDAVLLLNFETVILQRINGHLSFNSEELTSDLVPIVERLTKPDEMRSLPSPLL